MNSYKVNWYELRENSLLKLNSDLLNKEIVPLMKERVFPTGHKTKYISFSKIKDKLLCKLEEKITKNQSKLLQEESKLLEKIGIKSRIHLDRLSKTQKGHFSISTVLVIGRKESILKFYKDVGFSLSRKQNKLKIALMGANWINANI